VRITYLDNQKARGEEAARELLTDLGKLLK